VGPPTLHTTLTRPSSQGCSGKWQCSCHLATSAPNIPARQPANRSAMRQPSRHLASGPPVPRGGVVTDQHHNNLPGQSTPTDCPCHCHNLRAQQHDTWVPRQVQASRWQLWGSREADISAPAECCCPLLPPLALSSAGRRGCCTGLSARGCTGACEEGQPKCVHPIIVITRIGSTQLLFNTLSTWVTALAGACLQAVTSELLQAAATTSVMPVAQLAGAHADALVL
jgi:hypothetical protein